MNLTRMGAGSGLALCMVLSSSTPALVHGQATEDQTESASETRMPALTVSPFSDFETHYLDNGVRVWYRYFPEAPDISVSVTIPFGSDQDPVGREETAHFLEHVLFSDHAGRTEEEIKDEVESRGGVRNGFTAADRTWYYVSLPREQGTFGVEWLGRIVEPHTLDADVVARNRQPVILELALRPPEVPDLLVRLLDPAFMRPRDFWGREFGRPARSARVYSRWASLHAIAPEDLQAFYESHYTPRAMTVTVVGDLDRETALAAVSAAFGGLEGAAPPDPYPPALDPGRALSHTLWDLGANVRYRRYYKLYDPTAQDLADLAALRLILTRRLNQRLRYGERKAVYGISVNTTSRGNVAYLSVAAPVEPQEYDFFTQVLNEEIDRLRVGSDPAGFNVDRDAVVELLRAQIQSAQDVNAWIYELFYAPAFEDVPDLVANLEAHTAESMAGASGRLLRDDRRFERMLRPQPLPMVLISAAAALIVWLTFRLVAARLRTPARMDQVRFVGKLRWAPVERLARLGLGLAVTLVGLRLLFWLWTLLAVSLLVPIQSWWVQMVGYSMMGMVTLALCLIAMASRPRKVMVFTDHLRIKMLAWSSRVIPINTVESIEPIRVRGGRAVRVRAGGESWVWQLRDPDGFLRASAEAREAWVEPSKAG